MLTKFKDHIDTNFSFLRGKTILVAISGGIDSVVLMTLLHQLEFDISLAHCNFSLRGKDSDDDEQFVKNVAKKLGVSCHTIVFDTKAYAEEHGLSTQMAARKLRYDWFEKIRLDAILDYVATAHHLDDNLETFFINFIRGTGLNGLTGIPELKKKIIRPLLPFSKEEIKRYANENKLIWREDASNAKTAYQRNKIRHQIVPLLKEINPTILATFQNTTNYLKGSQDIINDKLNDLSDQIISEKDSDLKKIDVLKLKKLSNPKAYIFELLKFYGFTEWNDVVSLLDAQAGKQVLSNTHRLVKDRDFLLLTRIISAEANKVTYEIKEQEEIVKFDNSMLVFKQLPNNLQAIIGNQQQIRVDKDKLSFPLVLRKTKTGDYFYPFGMAGKKKLSKFLKDEKFSMIEKENTWLLCSENDIVWVVNKRLDDRYKVDESTKTILEIEYVPS